MVVVAAALGALWQFDIFEKWADSLGPDLREQVPDLGAIGNPLALAGAVLALVIALFVLLRLLSIALAVVRLHGFTLRRSGEDLRAD